MNMNIEDLSIKISQLIRPEDIENWKEGDIITIAAGTGAGKSYFVKNILYAFAKVKNKKILMLVHRSNCKNQFLNEVKEDKKDSIIDVYTYQRLERENFNFEKYEYIVCDEFHYFLGDAAFNKTTDISIEKILGQANKTRIFMSATGGLMQGYINKIKNIKTIDYQIPINFNFINSLTLFYKDKTIENILETGKKTKDKAIVFLDSAEKAYELYTKFKDMALFNCSKNNSKFYKYVDEEKIENMLKKERFEERFLITTTCLDAGVNIIDNNVKHIICSVKDFDSLVQCIGRKRRRWDEKVNLYIQNISNEKLGGMKGRCNRLLIEADYFLENGVTKYIEKYGRSKTDLIYDVLSKEGDAGDYNKKLNEMMYYKLALDSTEYDYIINNKGSYREYIKSKFEYEEKIREIKESIKDSIEEYLDLNVGLVMLQAKDRKELIEKLNVRSDGKLLKSISSLNSALEEQSLPYRITQFSTSKVIDGKQKRYNSAWKINKLVG